LANEFTSRVFSLNRRSGPTFNALCSRNSGFTVRFGIML
jgi:hypothetical protein